MAAGRTAYGIKMMAAGSTAYGIKRLWQQAVLLMA
jgi:hypothetical protein